MDAANFTNCDAVTVIHRDNSDNFILSLSLGKCPLDEKPKFVRAAFQLNPVV